MFLSFQPAAWVVLMLVITLYTLTLYSAFRFTRGMSMLASGVLTVALIFTLWLLPLFIEMCRWLLATVPNAPEDLSVISTFSPVGAMIIAWQDPQIQPPLVWGLCFQAGVMVFAWRIGSRRLRQLAATDAAEGLTSVPRIPALS